ncbi:MAG: MBL fold metallo-hydrolase [Cardiobacteriaceae bacterium]|nr:MBL fold metallo-hydrolase [Cardiobacteriaceae bacterium]
MAEITFFRTGYCLHPGAVAVSGVPCRPQRFPAQVALIAANGRRWLWDTGYARHFFTATRAPCYALYRAITPVRFRAQEAIAAQLAALGIPREDLQAILLSHFHADHIAGLGDFPGVPVFASGRGFAKIRDLRGLAALRHGFLPALLPHDFAARLHPFERLPRVALPSELAPFHEGWGIPESAGEIVIVELPGHAAGHCGAFVHTAQGWQLLAADAAFARANWRGQPPAPPARLLMDDARAFAHTLSRLRELDARGIAIHVSHEVS